MTDAEAADWLTATAVPAGPARPDTTAEPRSKGRPTARVPARPEAAGHRPVNRRRARYMACTGNRPWTATRCQYHKPVEHNSAATRTRANDQKLGRLRGQRHGEQPRGSVHV
ncbi:hypothetical protein GCM10023086_76890 [Streptomyces venetus]|uniref:Uncharacterized protein n=1 Tax=Streptomyces venetus TaxID=1701086 RepID=A0ABP8HL99_9ACTN